MWPRPQAVVDAFWSSMSGGAAKEYFAAARLTCLEFPTTACGRGYILSPLRGCSPRLCVIGNLSAHDGHDGLNVFNLIGWYRQVIAIQNQEIRQFACLNRTQIIFLEDKVSVLPCMRDQRIFTADGLAEHFCAADH